MNQSTRKMLNSSERQLLRETEPAKLRKRDEDELVELHRRVRRARTKYAKLYRRRASAQVKTHGTRAMASKANKRTSVKAEAFEDALARVSRRLAKKAAAEADQLREDRLAAARAGQEGRRHAQALEGDGRQGQGRRQGRQDAGPGEEAAAHPRAQAGGRLEPGRHPPQAGQAQQPLTLRPRRLRSSHERRRAAGEGRPGLDRVGGPCDVGMDHSNGSRLDAHRAGDDPRGREGHAPRDQRRLAGRARARPRGRGRHPTGDPERPAGTAPGERGAGMDPRRPVRPVLRMGRSPDATRGRRRHGRRRAALPHRRRRGAVRPPTRGGGGSPAARSGPAGDEDRDLAGGALLVLGVGRVGGHRALPPLGPLVAGDQAHGGVPRLGAVLDGRRPSGSATRLWYQTGWVGAPPWEATRAYSPSCSTRMSGDLAELAALVAAGGHDDDRHAGVEERVALGAARPLVGLDLVAHPLLRARFVLTLKRHAGEASGCRSTFRTCMTTDRSLRPGSTAWCESASARRWWPPARP